MRKVISLHAFINSPEKCDGLVIGMFEKSIIAFDVQHLDCCSECAKKRILASSYREKEEYGKYERKISAQKVKKIGEMSQVEKGMLELEEDSLVIREVHPILKVPGCKSCYGKTINREDV